MCWIAFSINVDQGMLETKFPLLLSSNFEKRSGYGQSLSTFSKLIRSRCCPSQVLITSILSIGGRNPKLESLRKGKHSFWFAGRFV
jgi:hypothetical protein